MSVIDERVVSMRFDNSNFESGVSDTLSTLEKLKKAISFGKSGESASEETGLSGISVTLETLQNKFSLLGTIGETAMQRIADAAVNLGQNALHTILIEPLTSGFSEYETQMNSVQTILANTREKGETIDTVNAALDKMNTYADKTIYNFQEMASNLGKFTAAGVGLEQSADAIMGISNLAAVSGSDSQQAARAMYNLSQALASGSLKLQDWNSVVNAGMGGSVFQEALKKTAKEYGTDVDAIIEKNGSFRDSLKDGWITSEILQKTLAKFTSGGLSEYLADVTGKEKSWVEEQINAIAASNEQESAIQSLANTLGETGKITSDVAKKYIEDMLSAENAATKVKTFSQLIDTVKEGLGSGWTQSWQYIIGDFEEAKAMWSVVSDEINNIINPIADARNAMLKFWHDPIEEAGGGGRDTLLTALGTLWDMIKSISGTIKSGFGSGLSEMIGVVDGQTLVDLTNSFKTFVDGLAALGNSDAWRGAKSELEIIFAYVGSFVGQVGTILLKLLSIFPNVFGKLSERMGTYSIEIRNVFRAFESALGVITDLFIKLDEYGALTAFGKGLGNILVAIIGWIGDIVWKVASFFEAIKETQVIDFFADALTNLAEGFEKLTSHLDPYALGGLFYRLVDKFHEFTGIKPDDKWIKYFDDFEHCEGWVYYKWDAFVTALREQGVTAAVKVAFENLGETIQAIVFGIFGVSENSTVGKALNGAINAIDGFVEAVLHIFDELYNGASIGEAFSDVIYWLDNTIPGFAKFREIVGNVVNFFVEKFGQLKSFIVEHADVWKTIFNTIFGVLSKFGSVIGKVLSKIPDILSFVIVGVIKFAAFIKNNFSGILDLFKSIGEGIAEFAEHVKEKIEPIKDIFFNAAQAVTDFFGRFRGGSGGQDGTEEAKKKVDIIGFISTTFHKFVEFLKKVGAKLAEVGGKIGKALPQIFAYLGSEDFRGVLTTVNTALGGGLLFQLMGFVNSLKGLFSKDGLLGVLDSFKEAAGNVGDTLKGVADSIGEGIGALKEKVTGQSDDIGGTLLKVAAAIVIITGVVYALSKMDVKQLGHGFAALVVSVGVLLVAFKALQVIMGHDGFSAVVFGQVTTSLIKFSVAVAILAAGINILASLDWKGVAAGLAAVAGLMMVFTASVILMTKFGPGIMDQATSFKTVSKSLLSFAIAIGVLTLAVKALGSMETGALAKGILGVVALVAIMTTFTRLAKTASLSFEGAFSIIIITSAIKKLGKVVTQLGSLDTASYIKGLLGVGALLAEITLFMNLAKFNVLSFEAAASLLITTEAVKVLAKAAATFASMDLGQFMQAMIGVVGMGLALGLLVEGIGKADIKVGTMVGMLVAVAALKQLSNIVKDIGGMSIQEMCVAMIGLAGSVAALVVPMLLIGTLEVPLLAGAAAMIEMAAALTLLMVPVEKFSSMSVDQLITGLVGLAGTLVTIGAVAALFGTYSPLLELGAGVLTSLGYACIVCGAGIAVLGGSITFVSTLSAAAGKIIKALGESFVGMFGLMRNTTWATGFVAQLSIVVMGVIGLIGQIIMTIAEGIPAFATAIGNGAPAIFEAVVKVLSGVLGAIETIIPKIAEVIVKIVVKLLETFNQYLPVILELGAKLIVAICVGIQKYLPMIADAAVTMVITLVNSFAEGVREHGPEVLAAINNVLSSIAELVLTALSDVLGSIPLVGDDIKKQLDKAREELATTFGQEATKKQAEQMMDGMSQGIDNKSGDVSNSIGGLATKSMSGFGLMETIAEKTGINVDSLMSGAIDTNAFSVEGSMDNLTGMMEGKLEGMDFASIGDGQMGDLFSSIQNGNSDVSSIMETFTGEGSDALLGGAFDFQTAGETDLSSWMNVFTSSDTLSDAKEAGEGLSSEAANGVQQNVFLFKDAGVDSVQGYADGLADKDAMANVEENAGNVGELAIGSLRESLDSHSPSKKAAEAGSDTTEGFSLGIVDKKALKGVEKGAKELSDHVIAALELETVAKAAGKAIAAEYSEGVVEGIDVTDDIDRAVSEMTMEIEGLKAEAATDGDELASVFAEAIASTDALSLIKASSMTAADTAVFALQEALDSQVPKERAWQMGMDTSYEFGRGLFHLADMVEYNGQSIADKSVDAMSESLTRLKEYAAMDISNETMIRPILDMDEFGKAMRDVERQYSGRTLDLQASLGAGSGLMTDLTGTINSISKLTLDTDTIGLNSGGLGDTLRNISNHSINSELDGLRDDLQEATAAILNMKMVTDTGAVIGEFADPMNRALGNILKRQRRRNL